MTPERSQDIKNLLEALLDQLKSANLDQLFVAGGVARDDSTVTIVNDGGVLDQHAHVVWHTLTLSSPKFKLVMKVARNIGEMCWNGDINLSEAGDPKALDDFLIGKWWPSNCQVIENVFHKIEEERAPSVTAVAYYRTSVADINVLKSQQEKIYRYSIDNSLPIVHEYSDPVVQGFDPITHRPGFIKMISFVFSNHPCIILVETISHFSPDLIVQETGYQFLKNHDTELISIDSPNHFRDFTVSRKMVRDIMEAQKEFEKIRLVKNLKTGRDQKRMQTGRCEGPKQAPEAHRNLAKSLRAEGLSLGKIGLRLADEGFLAPSGRPYLAESVKRMLR